MNKDTALRLALEALEKTQSALARCIGPHKSEEGDRHRALAYSRTTITAIKAALEKKDEPDYNICPTCGGMSDDPIVPREHRFQSVELEAKDEAWEKFCDSNCVWTDHHPDCKLAQRTWAGLTDEDIGMCLDAGNGSMSKIISFIEAKLKEKNT